MRTISFGWDGDGGLGDRLIAQIIAGEKTATCGLRGAYTEDELAEVATGAGQLHSVRDRTGAHRCTIRVTETFECTFGDPDPRLVAGEGDGDDVEKFKADHRIAWRADMGDEPLTDDALLVVELFQLIAEDPRD